MTFAARETSRSRGAPDTLYRFAYQNRVYAYTDAEQSITFAGTEYAPIPIDRNSITTSGTLEKTTLNVTLPHDTEVAELFRIFPPSDVVTITLFQGHHTDIDAEFLAVWTGRVISCARETTEATLMCEPVSTSMKRPGLRRRYQYGCPHVLYGPQCKASRAANTVSATVASVSGATVTLTSGWNGAFAEADFLDGLFQWEVSGETELRTILRVNTGPNSVVLSGRTNGVTVGMTVELSRGCNHQMSGCNAFANIQNFGGQPWIPKKNPIGFVNQYY